MIADADEDEGKVEHVFSSVHFPQMSEKGPRKDLAIWLLCIYPGT